MDATKIHGIFCKMSLYFESVRLLISTSKKDLTSGRKWNFKIIVEDAESLLVLWLLVEQIYVLIHSIGLTKESTSNRRDGIIKKNYHVREKRLATSVGDFKTECVDQMGKKSKKARYQTDESKENKLRY